LGDDDCAHRNFSGFESALGTAQGFLHPEFVSGRFARARINGGGDGPLIGRWHLGARRFSGGHGILCGYSIEGKC